MAKQETLFAAKQRKYSKHIQLSQAQLYCWASERGIAIVTAHALHMIATQTRTANAIYENIERDEVERLTSCIKELVDFKDYDLSENAITLPSLRF